MSKKIAIIGAGFSGLASAAFLARRGYDVEVFEKNHQPGGRARNFMAGGFTFDMGPTWYWMPDVFENFFAVFGKKPEDYYQLIRLDPSYRIYFAKDDYMDIPAKMEGLFELFESLEAGSAKKLKKFLEDAGIKYRIAMKDLIYKPGLSFTEFMQPVLLLRMFQLGIFKSMSSYVRGMFKNDRIRQILEFPVLFLGAEASSTPALYSLMNYADLELGTWYPMGGMYKVVDAMLDINCELGVKMHFNSPVESLQLKNSAVKGLVASGKSYDFDALVGSGDYNHIEQSLLPENYQSYSKKYWDTRKLAPSAILFYLGVNKKVKNLLHHNLFFDVDFENHVGDIYKMPKWPTNPAIYVSVSSKTDSSIAPEGCENIIVLIPVASGLTDSVEIREKYYAMVLKRLEKITGENLENHIVYKRVYTHNDFVSDYNAFKGNAYGLANTLLQTAILKPKMNHSKVKNLFYCGQLTVPGPGVPPSLISGQIVSKLVTNYLNK